MRVIAGSAKRLRLKTLEAGYKTDDRRIKETLFNMIGRPCMTVCSWICSAGAAALDRGAEQGAKEAVFVENNPKAMACIKENLKFTRLEAKAVTMTRDVMNALLSAGRGKGF